jgi:putative restriction endonuclease
MAVLLGIGFLAGVITAVSPCILPVLPRVANGLSLCSIHHRAFDQDLVGVAPNYRVHVSQRLLTEDDGPMLDLLKGFHQQTIEVPSRRAWKPNPEALARRFERFSTLSR